jgi:hypothetical protein
LSHPDLLAHTGVTPSARADLTRDHLAGIESHPQLQLHTIAVLHFDGKPLRLVLHAQGRQASTNGVVLQGHRCTKHRHDPVTGELVHRAPIPLHYCRGTVDQFGHDLAQPLRADGRGDVHRMDHVGEQNRDLLVLRVDIAVFDW